MDDDCSSQSSNYAVKRYGADIMNLPKKPVRQVHKRIGTIISDHNSCYSSSNKLNMYSNKIQNLNHCDSHDTQGQFMNSPNNSIQNLKQHGDPPKSPMKLDNLYRVDEDEG